MSGYADDPRSDVSQLYFYPFVQLIRHIFVAVLLDTHISKIGELEELKQIRTNQDNKINAGKQDVAIL